MLTDDVFRDQLHNITAYVAPFKIHSGDAEVFTQGIGNILWGDEIQLNQGFPQLVPGGALELQCFPQLFLAQQSFLKNVSQALAVPL